jgi:hypothetical protein
MEEGTTQVITGAFKLAYNRGHYTRLHQVESHNKVNRQTITPHKILTRLRLAV